MTIQFYSKPMSSGTRVHWALEELGIPYELVPYDPARLRTPEYLAINPNGKIPAMVDGGVNYFESTAIIVHLGEAYGKAKGLWPAEGQARAEALSWTVWAGAELHFYLWQYIYHGLDSPVSYKPEQRSAATAAWNLKNFTAHLDMLEARLRDREYLLGSFTLVDCTVATMLLFGTRMGVQLGDHGRVQAWLERCKARPALARSA
jgi:glutathione S-transferase